MRCLLFTLLFTQLFVAQSFKIIKTVKLPKKVAETSGIIYLNKSIVTFNDSGGKPELYVINPKTGNIKKTVKVKNAKNIDWEAITQDHSFIYVADTGNNYGNRKNLAIYKISKKDFSTKKTVKASKIYFSYENQTAFKAQKYNTNFDCESIAIRNNKILIFTKNWGNFKTNIYQIPLNKGTYKAKKINSININCLLTAIHYNAKTNIFIGTAYDKDYKSYLIKINGLDTGNPQFKKINLQPTFAYANQIEAICLKSDHEILMTREASKKRLNGKNYKHKQKLFFIALEKD